MAILSNINGKFAVDSTGAIQFSGAAGTSGYILESAGVGASPTWIPKSDIVGNYLPLTGGVLTGATSTASGIAFTVGGALTGLTSSFVSTVAGTTVVSSEGAYSSSASVKLYEAKRAGGAVASDWSYNESVSPLQMEIGTSTSHSFAIKTANTPRLTINNSGNALFAGSATFNQFITMSSTQAEYGYINLGATSTYGWQIGKGPSSGGVVGNESFYIYNFSNSTVPVEIDTSNNFIIFGQNNGYDGTLQVGARAYFQHRDAGQTTTSILSTYNNDNTTLNFRLKGVSDADAQMTIKGSGKVGIGNSTPNNKLSVQTGTDSRLEVWGGSTYAAIQSVNDANTVLKDMRFDASEYRFVGGDVKIAEASNKGQLFFGTANTDYEIKGGGNWGYLSLNAPYLRFDTGGTERMRIDSAGYVGVNRTTNLGTYTKLGVGFTTYGNAANIDEAVNYSAIELYPLRGGSSYGLFTGGGNTWAYMQVASDTSPNRASGAIGLNPWGGNVGIGTTSPATPLDVRRNDTGTAAILTLRQMGIGDASIDFQTTTSPYGFNIGVDASDGEKFKIASGLGNVGSNTKLTIDPSNGNVGIREANPSYTLDVNTASDSLAGMLIQAGHSSQGEIQNTGLIIGVNNDISTGDYMGISFSGNAATPARGRAAIGAKSMNGPSGMDLVFMTRSAADGSQLGTADVKMTILSGGNVGINDTSPGTKLSINGANYVEMATFSAAGGSISGIITNNVGYVTGFTTSATHVNSNAALFVPVTNGIKITKAGLVQVTVTQDFISTLSSGYCSVQIRKNGTTMFYSLRTNSNNQWDMISSTGTMLVAANDEIGFYYSATDFTSMDTGSWSQYSFIWTSR